MMGLMVVARVDVINRLMVVGVGDDGVASSS